MNLKIIDEGLHHTDITQRKKHLIKQLHNLEVYNTSDGRKLEDVSLYTLEWTFIEAKNDVALGYGENYS